MTDSDTTAFSTERSGNIEAAPPLLPPFAQVVRSEDGFVMLSAPAQVDDQDVLLTVSRADLLGVTQALNLAMASLNVFQSQQVQFSKNERDLTELLSITQSFKVKADEIINNMRAAGDKLFNALLGVQPGLQEHAFDVHGMGYIMPADGSYLDHAIDAIDAWALVSPE